MSTSSIHSLLMLVDVHIPQSQSLKQKRSVIKSLVEKLRARFNASVAETGYLDEWQRSQLSIAMVSNDRRYLQKQLALVEQHLLEVHDISVLRIEQHWI
ncbi:MAG: DUF503 domain-containing protein [Gammaproteobacteria bacterium]